jgi:hypothetical protein
MINSCWDDTYFSFTTKNTCAFFRRIDPARIFQGFPDWELSQEQVHLIRRSGLVPDTLLCLGMENMENSRCLDEFEG